MIELNSKALNEILNGLVGTPGKIRKISKAELIARIEAVTPQLVEVLTSAEALEIEELARAANVHVPLAGGEVAAPVTVRTKKNRSKSVGGKKRNVAVRLANVMQELCNDNNFFYTVDEIAAATADHTDGGLRVNTVANYLAVWNNPSRVDQPAPFALDRQRNGRVVSWRVAS